VALGSSKAGEWKWGQILNCHILERLHGTGRRPLDKQKKATETVIQQAELLGKEGKAGVRSRIATLTVIQQAELLGKEWAG
jgi:hypothetical protein